jgi:ABC-type molybdenum transport system ATPase subunit/photorepair protein PhrA
LKTKDEDEKKDDEKKEDDKKSSYKSPKSEEYSTKNDKETSPDQKKKSGWFSKNKKKVEEVDKSTVSLDSFLVLKDIDLKVKKGEFVCIIGDVGAGKSSLLSSIIGDLIPFKYSQVNEFLDQDNEADT